MRLIDRVMRKVFGQRAQAIHAKLRKWDVAMEWLKAHSPVSRLDRYLIGKFLGTYFFSIILIISIAVVFDINENIDKFLTRNATLKEIFVDYYLNFIPYYSNLFSQLFVFISVIFFTTKLAENSEIIAMMSTGVSFRRLMRPYMIAAALLTVMTYLLSAYVIPRGNVKRVKFENTYKRRNVPNYAANVQLEVDTGVIAYISRYENPFKTGYDFTLDKFEDKKLVSRLQAMSIQYDSLSEEPYHWIINNYQIRNLQGRREVLIHGTRIDSVIHMEPQDFLITKGQQETLTTPELATYIERLEAWRFGLRYLHPHNHWTFNLGQKAKKRNGHCAGHWLGPHPGLHHVPDHLFHLCHQCQHAPRSGCMATQHCLCLHCVLLLQESTSINIK